MNVVHLFVDALPVSEVDRERMDRIARNGGRLLKVARHGAKVSPAAIWVDAAISVCDAIAAWARYEQAREITRQLQAQCDTLRHMCNNVARQLELGEEQIALESRHRLTLIGQRLHENRRQTQTLVTSIVQRRGLIEQLRGSVGQLRQTTLQAPQALFDLEAAVETLVRAQLQTLLHSMTATDSGEPTTKEPEHA